MDFAQHIARASATDPETEWVFVVDQLNTHMSEMRVRVAAAECGIEDNLGIKDKTGILKSMVSRMIF